MKCLQDSFFGPVNQFVAKLLGKLPKQKLVKFRKKSQTGDPPLTTSTGCKGIRFCLPVTRHRSFYWHLLGFYFSRRKYDTEQFYARQRQFKTTTNLALAFIPRPNETNVIIYDMKFIFNKPEQFAYTLKIHC